MIPKHLRWDLPPNDGLFDDESNKEWCDFVVSKGLELLRLLLTRKQRKNKWLESQIKEITDRIESSKNTTKCIQLSGELKNKLVKWDKETQDKKVKKFLRDLNDFGGQQVFKWQSLNVMRTDTALVSMETNGVEPGILPQVHSEGVTPWVAPVPPPDNQNRNFKPKTRGRNFNKPRSKGQCRGNHHQTPNRGGYTHYQSVQYLEEGGSSRGDAVTISPE